MSLTNFEMLKGRHDVDVLSGFDANRVTRTGRGPWHVELDQRSPLDRAQFRAWCEQDVIALNGTPFKVLGRFDPAFDTPEVQRVMRDTRKAKEELPAMRERLGSAQVETELFRELAEQNTDPGRVRQLLEEQRSAEGRVELAEEELRATERQIRGLEAKLHELLKAHGQEDAARLRKQLGAAAQQFNDQIRATYARFHGTADPLFRQLGELGLPSQVGYASPNFNPADGGALKSLRAVPQLAVQQDGLHFTLEEIR
jgi:hypothetical protein